MEVFSRFHLNFHHSVLPSGFSRSGFQFRRSVFLVSGFTSLISDFSSFRQFGVRHSHFGVFPTPLPPPQPGGRPGGGILAGTTRARCANRAAKKPASLARSGTRPGF